MPSFKRKGEMTKVHFEMLASVLTTWRAKYKPSDAEYRALCIMLADRLAQTNPEFSRPKFLGTLGV